LIEDRRSKNGQTSIDFNNQEQANRWRIILMHPRPQLTSAEKAFLHAWMWEEAHPAYALHEGAVKSAQIDNSPYAAPLLVDMVVAVMSPEEQVALVNGPVPEGNPPWPWKSDEELRARHQQAKTWLEQSRFHPV
jgi:hypothetical protein